MTRTGWVIFCIGCIFCAFCLGVITGRAEVRGQFKHLAWESHHQAAAAVQDRADANWLSNELMETGCAKSRK